MPLANLITPKKINVLGGLRFSFSFILIAFFFPAFSQDNSPYSRYGLGDLVPSTNMNTRGMGGISAGYADFLSINFNNPASYSSFQALKEAKAKKILYGRAILDLGLNIENHTLAEPNRTGKFTSSNALFSHVQIGIPLRANWGLSFGLRPITQISYKINQGGKVLDAVTGLPTADSTQTLSQGDGGTYLASAGTGFRIGKLSLGFNGGYLFGKKDYSSRRSIINDTVAYNSGNFETKTTYGKLYFNMGLQYLVKLDSSTFMTLGAYGNLKQKLNATQDIVRETFYYDPNAGNVRIDSAYEKNGIKGKVEYPSSFTAGFIIQRVPDNKKGGWLIGVDFSESSWKNYSFYDQVDSLRNNWEIRVGGELRPSLGSARKSYFGNVAYRAGFFFGPDYIQVKEKLPVLGLTLGLGLPIRNYNRLSPGQATLINLAVEYIKRGNNNNSLKENMFRISVGFSLSDFWFAKKKYE
ncbi:MAG: hypothetical protein Q8941_19570 [Bacteroidota bacterium]|nr:hypothetical protein [Bacteroidota bacterium]